jgi:hypothetical protein
MNSQTTGTAALVRANMTRVIGVAAVCLGLLLICAPLHSQGNTGRILGIITDETGGIIPGTTVTVTDVQRGLTRSLIPDAAGAYAAPNLLPGTYTVRAEAKGFRPLERAGLLLEVGKDVHVDLTLQPGELTQAITVTEAAPLVETTNATLGGTLSNETINGVPLNGRNYQNLLSLLPGVTIFPGGASSSQSANGMRPEDNVFVLDGLNNNEPYQGRSVTNVTVLAGDATTILPIDAIQEFNTEENPKAEYGWNPGAVVVIGLKSGTNKIHGTAYAFGRSDAFDARDYFNAVPAPKAPVALEQFGATAGGPIKKDKIFWFGAYEGQRYSLANTQVTNVPVTASVATPANPAGNPAISLVDACKAVGFPTVNAVSAHIAGLNPDCSVKPSSGIPGPNESMFPTNNGPSTSVVPGIASNNQTDNGLGKIDYHVNDRHSLNGTFFFGQDNANFNDAPNEVLPIWNTLVRVRSIAGGGGWTWTPNSSMVNEIRVGYSHFYQSFLSADHSVNPVAFGINTGVTNPLFFGFPEIQIAPFPVPQLRLGAMWPRILGPEDVLQVLDHVSVLRGKHAFKLGGEFLHNGFTGNISSNAKGFIKFQSLEGFLNGTPAGSGSAILVGNPERHIHNEQYAAFLQDDWRATPKLTLNLGLRYELDTVVRESNNLLANFDPTLGLVQVGHGISSPYNGDHNNFAPRVGLAWDIQSNAKYVLRAGASMMYETIPLVVFVAPGNGNGLFTVPTGASITTCPASCMTSGIPVTTPGIVNGIAVTSVSVPGGPGSALASNWQSNGTVPLFQGNAVQCGDGLTPPNSSVADRAPCNVAAVDRNLRNPYVTTWTLGIEHAFTDNLALEVAYVGNHGTKLIGITDINQPTAASGYTAGVIATGDPSLVDPVAEQASRPFDSKFPYLGFINRISNLDQSNYNALQVTLTQRASRGLSFKAGYTYSHALDNVSSSFQALIPADSTHPGRQYASTDFDMRHRFTLTATYTLPGKAGFAQLLQGWQLNTVVTLSSGAPWGAMDMSNDFSGTGEVTNIPTYGQPWNFVGNPNDFKAGREPFSCWSGSGGAALGGCPLGAEPERCKSAAGPVGTPTRASLDSVGCYVRGNSVLIPPALGTLGAGGRNIWRDLGYRGWDLSLSKNTTFRERLTAQFRAEVFNILNHPSFANPWGPYQFGFNDPSTGFSGGFGCGCATPDVASSNPVLGSGGNRSIQLGLKLIF